MSYFSEGSTGRSIEIESENSVSEKNVGEGVETRSDSSSWGLGSALTRKEIDMLVRGYGLAEKEEARLPRGNTTRVPGRGYVFVFENQLNLGLRFPVFQLLRDLIEYYGLSITQLFPLGICMIVAFEMACRS